MILSPKMLVRYFIRIQDYFYLNVFLFFVGIFSLTELYLGWIILPAGLGTIIGLLFDTFLGGASWLFLLWSLAYSANKKFRFNWKVPSFRKIIIFLLTVAFLLSSLEMGGLVVGGVYSIIAGTIGKAMSIVVATVILIFVTVDLFNLDISFWSWAKKTVKSSINNSSKDNYSPQALCNNTQNEQTSINVKNSIPFAGFYQKRKYKIPIRKNLGFDDCSEVTIPSDKIDKELVVAAFADFNVVCEIVEVLPGLMIDLVSLRLSKGQKIQTFKLALENVAIQMGHKEGSLRMVDNTCGQPGIIMIEVPRLERSFFDIQAINIPTLKKLSHEDYLEMFIGMDAHGKPISVDLSKLPHMLISGTTGSGKSFALNTMLITLLLKYTPNQLKLILIDPKKVEFSVYEGIPHLSQPVVTDPNESIEALSALVRVMDERFTKLQKHHARNINEFNIKADTNAKKVMPYIVVIIDELSDLMMIAGKEAESQIIKIAQKARACGIHLILATQRPSADVVTGLMKANIPSRLALKTASRIDSNIILDKNGAEFLLGKGDALLKIPESDNVTRIQIPAVQMETINSVTEYWRNYGK